MFNATPGVGQEWRIYTFNLDYISCNSDDQLNASDVIFQSNFYTLAGASLPIAATGTLGNTYKGSGIFDVKLYPGSSSKVVYMILTDISNGPILLKVPTSAGKDAKWILC